MLIAPLEDFEMPNFSKFILVTFTAVSSSAHFAYADAQNPIESRHHFCADVISIVFDPETGEQIFARDLCEYNELIAKGYVADAPVCAFTFGFVRHPETSDTQHYRNTCELNALLRAGYSEFLRQERTECGWCLDS